MAAAAKPGLRDFDVFALISKWSLEAEGEKNFQSDYSFGSLRTTASRAVHELGRLAHSGHEDAAKALLALLSASVSGFDKLCHATPELFEPIARKRTFWPGLISLISHTQNQNKKLIKLLNLGIDSGLNVSGKQGVVYLKSGVVQPLLIRAASATFTVNRADDPAPASPMMFLNLIPDEAVLLRVVTNITELV